MDALMKLSREVQIILGGGIVLLIFSFLNWQQQTIYGYTGGLNEWHGIGILAALLVIAMLVWEVLRLMQAKIELGALSPALISVALALLMALFTVIAFFNKSEFRHWPAWVGLIAALGVAAAAVMRARGEGVQMPEMKGAGSGGGDSAGGGGGTGGGDGGGSEDGGTEP